MTRRKLSRQEKLLFATPLLLPLLVLAWPLIWPVDKVNSFDKTLQELAGPEAVDCGRVDPGYLHTDPCAMEAIKTGKPFHVQGFPAGIVGTPKGEVYFVLYQRGRWPAGKSSIMQTRLVNPRVKEIRTTTLKIVNRELYYDANPNLPVTCGVGRGGFWDWWFGG
jgi:hypothetical protein